MRKSEVIVVGAGIAGLTSAAILSKQGLSVNLIESHTQSGCLLYTSPSPRDLAVSRMPSSA